MTDVEYQMNNWYHFLWTCGDHIVEQHVHNVDVCNWAMRTHPIRCDGAGGRAGSPRARPSGPPDQVGNIFDHFSIDYVYPGEVHMYSSCRHIPGTAGNVSEAVVGTKGQTYTSDDGRVYKVNDKQVMTRAQMNAIAGPYVQEHTDLIECIRGAISCGV